MMKNYNRYYYIFFAALVLFTSCKKDSGSNNNNSQADTTATANGKAIMFLKQDCNVGNVTVTINNVTRLIKDTAPEQPECDADSSYAIFSLPPGTYKVNAVGGNQQWNASVTVTSGQCTGLQLTCDGVVPILKGAAGYPRFNLQHTPGVDLDLHVLTPDGSEISPYYLTGQGGTMDVESSCLGSDTNILYGLSATNENVWFQAGHAAHGTYKFWVQFGGTCTNSLSGSYSLRVIDGLSTVTTYTGTITVTDVNAPLNTYNSPVYTLVY
jgi:hypothetical protein